MIAGISPVAIVSGVVAILATFVASYCIARSPDAIVGKDYVAATPVAAVGSDVRVTIDEGASAGDVARELKARGVIRSERQFRLLVRLMGLQDRLSAGEHVLQRGSSTLAAIDDVTVKPAGATVRITFPEGLRVEEMAVIAERQGIGTAKEFLDAVRKASLPQAFAESLPPVTDAAKPWLRFQGYLFPDTYLVLPETTPAELVSLMVETLDRRFSPELRAAVAARGLTLHQALTLASIVEREAVVGEERPLIAGVFYNRLADNLTLGADPTVQYALTTSAASVEAFGWWKKELFEPDLEIDSPYNTRKFTGIPPGPIASPGLASIEAVARPAETQFYYFVADAKANDGRHRFAVTFEEHQRNIALYGSPD